MSHIALSKIWCFSDMHLLATSLFVRMNVGMPACIRTAERLSCNVIMGSFTNAVQTITVWVKIR